ncbi:MAG: hypothetical protein QG622_2408 [Actinomycetota bacterium]|nr:hypothetical protein [Actinomycetota bacterium]
MEATRTDRLRQVTVTISAVACVIGTLYGTGVLGTTVQNSSGGRLSADATLIAPAGTAFSIWSVIYAGLGAYTVWQWLPTSTTSPRARAIGWLASASMLLNAGWLLVTLLGWLPVSVAVIVALLAVLLVINYRLIANRANTGPVTAFEKVAIDGTFGLYLGWVSVATFANIAAVVTGSPASSPSGLAEAAAVATLLVVSGVGVALARTLGGRATVAAAMMWGLSWIAVGRTTDEPRSLVTAVAALAAVVIIGAATYWSRTRGPRTATASDGAPAA